MLRGVAAEYGISRRSKFVEWRRRDGRFRVAEFTIQPPRLVPTWVCTANFGEALT